MQECYKEEEKKKKEKLEKKKKKKGINKFIKNNDINLKSFKDRAYIVIWKGYHLENKRRI